MEPTPDEPAQDEPAHDEVGPDEPPEEAALDEPARAEATAPRRRSSPLASLRRLFEEMAADPSSSQEVSEREAAEDLRGVMAPAYEALMEEVPGVSSPEEAATALAAQQRPKETGGDESPTAGVFVSGDLLEAVVQYRLRDHFIQRPALGEHEHGNLRPGTSQPYRSPPGPPTEYIEAFNERMRARSQPDTA
jgi:hypothetical protein